MANRENPALTLTADSGAPMSAEQAALLKRLSQEAYDFEAFSPHLSQAEAARRIAVLQAKLKLQSYPPHTQ
jgi:hypothetical protein